MYEQCGILWGCVGPCCVITNRLCRVCGRERSCARVRARARACVRVRARAGARGRAGARARRRADALARVRACGRGCLDIFRLAQRLCLVRKREPRNEQICQACSSWRLWEWATSSIILVRNQNLRPSRNPPFYANAEESRVFKTSARARTRRSLWSARSVSTREIFARAAISWHTFSAFWL